MKLSQLYANKSFKSIVFNDGLNLVLAKVTRKKDRTVDSHNLGKTTLITILDFMLLKELRKEHIFKEHEKKFSDYTFFLEILLNNGSYLTIRRSVDAPTKIAFKITSSPTRLLNEQTWDLNATSMEKAVKALNTYLSFDVLTNWNFRKYVTYFLRTQKDYNDVFQLSKFQGKDIDWKPLIFDILGFEGNMLVEKYEVDSKINDKKRFINQLKNEFAVNTEEADKIRGSLDLKKSEQAELQTQIDNFNFFQQERFLNKELVEEVEKKISDLNTVEYNLSFDLEKAKNSLSKHISFDMDQLEQLFQEVKIYFPDNLIKDYKALEDFNKKITEERNKYLKERILTLSKELKLVKLDLQEQNAQRQEMLSILKDKDSFKKFKLYQTELAKIEGEVVRLEEKLKSLDSITLLNESIHPLKERLEQLEKEIGTQLSSSKNTIYSDIRKVFHTSFREIFHVPALIFITQNGQGNVDFKVEVTQHDEAKITAESKGNTYQKMLCVCFDLALLVAYYKNSFYRFVYHDGALEGLDNRKKENFIAMARKYCAMYNIQYIFTAIEHDIPVDILDTFTDKEICLTLNDSGEEGRLFEFSF